MGTLEPTTMQSYLDYASDAALAWTTAEQAYWSGLADRLSDAAAGLSSRMPHVSMVKTTGLEEFAVYTRNRSIVLPQARLHIAGIERSDFFLLAHELFHAISRENPAQRDALHALLGFEGIGRNDDNWSRPVRR